MAERRYDLVLAGATGFTGGLTADYLAVHAPRQLRWALVGRDRAKLATVVAGLAGARPDAPSPDILVADAADGKALRAVAETSKVVITTVGPYVFYGEPLVAACVAAGTDYVDITGETEFVDRIWLKHHAEAERRAARLIHCCGFTAIAQDLGAYFTVQQLPADVSLRIDAYVRLSLRLSGGSYHSLLHSFARSRQRRAAAQARQESEPVPAARQVRAASGRIRRDPRLGGWVMPLSSISATTVRRTAAALDRYGPEFSYGHHTVFKHLPAASGVLLGAAGARVLARLPPARKLLLKVKAPGKGPTEAERERGWFKLVFVGEGGGRLVATEVSGGDPGYTETAKMLAESALCIAFDDLPQRFGQLTPAVAMGDALLARLGKAGISFRVTKTSAA
jgi:saccharopine dehydrogenase (NAD+, L-glutamate forming)